MANCTYLTDKDGNAITCPEETPSADRCALCMLMILISRSTHVLKKPIDYKIIEAKLPS